MQNLIITGNGSYSQMMRRYIENTDFGNVVAYTVESAFIQSNQLDGLPVIPLEDLKERFSYDDVDLVMGIGYKRMGSIRKQIFERCSTLGYKFINYIHPTVIIEKNVSLGNGNNILEGVILEEGVVLGNANLLFGGSLIAHETQIGDYNTFSVKAVVAGCTKIGNQCFVGASATVKDHIRLKDYVLIGAGAYAYKNMEEYAVVVPVESRILTDKRSIDLL